MTDQVASDNAHHLQERFRLKRKLGIVLWCLDHWVLLVSAIFGFVNGIPFLAPIFMRVGWTGLARGIYTAYSLLCHQMAQRSFFLFGAQPMYNLAQLPVLLTDDKLANMEVLRAFIGNPELGWKVAWSDRMVYMFGALWLAGILFGLLRHYRMIRPLNVGSFIVLMLPMVVDGVTHLVSDVVGGLAGGFRYTNPWLVSLTRGALPTWFYVGDALGSFNSWMRLISGLAFGVGTVWLGYPYLNRSIAEMADELRAKLILLRS